MEQVVWRSASTRPIKSEREIQWKIGWQVFLPIFLSLPYTGQSLGQEIGSPLEYERNYAFSGHYAQKTKFDNPESDVTLTVPSRKQWGEEANVRSSKCLWNISIPVLSDAVSRVRFDWGRSRV